MSDLNLEQLAKYFYNNGENDTNKFSSNRRLSIAIKIIKHPHLLTIDEIKDAKKYIKNIKSELKKDKSVINLMNQSNVLLEGIINEGNYKK